MVDDVVVGIEDAVGQPVVAHELPDVLDGLSSGARGGRVRIVMLAGTSSLAEVCQPA